MYDMFMEGRQHFRLTGRITHRENTRILSGDKSENFVRRHWD